MNIAYIINSLEGGGAALPVPDIARVMRDAGHHVTVFALERRDGRALSPMLDAGLDVMIRSGRRKDHASALRWLDRAIAHTRPTHLWTSLTRATLLGQLIGLKQRKPVISWQHNAYLKPANTALLRLMRNRSQLWIADSHCVEAESRNKLGIAPDRLTCWPIFRANDALPVAKPWQPGETLRIGSLGRLHAAKGYDTLCEALHQLRSRSDLPPFMVHIAGEGAERPALEERIARDNLPVRLEGYRSDVPAFLATCHLYLQPSRREGLCIAAHEAMLCGLPVIVSAVGELPYSVTPECGIVVPPAQPDALAAALVDLLTHPALLHEYGRKARARMLDRFGAAHFETKGRTILARCERFQ